jgi:predicted small secreted protein
MKRVLTIAAAVLMATGLAACKNTGSPTADSTQSASSAVTTPASSSAPPSTKASIAAGATRTTLDPCRLVTQAEASAMAHASYGPGLEQRSPGARRCVYGSQTANVLTVVAAAASSDAEAKAHWDQLLTEAQQGLSEAPAGSVNLTPESGLADRAEWVELDLSAIHVSARGLAFLSGSTGVYMIDLVRDGAAPSRPDMTDQANTVLGRLP